MAAGPSGNAGGIYLDRMFPRPKPDVGSVASNESSVGRTWDRSLASWT